MVRTCSAFLLGVLVAMLLMGVVTRELLPPPALVTATLIFVAVTSLSMITLRTALNRRRERCALDLLSTSPADESLARRLLGDFPPYVIEAAAELGARRDPAAVPLLMQAVEVLVSGKPSGWREMIGAMVSAFGQIGDPRPLTLLRRLQTVPGAGEIENLGEVIAALEPGASLLRPADPENRRDHDLLRPAGAEADRTDPRTLLRPHSSSDASE